MYRYLPSGYILRTSLRTPLAINSCRDYSTGISSSLAAREESLYANMLERVAIADYTYRT